MVGRIGRGDLVIEQSGENEADAGASCAADIGKNGLQGRHSHGHNVAQDKDGSRNDRESEVTHRLRSPAGPLPQEGVPVRGGVAIGRGLGPPAQHCVNGGPARVALKRIREHDKHDDSSAANRGPKTRWVHAHDISADTVSKGEVPSNGHKNVSGGRTADTGQDNTGGSEMAVVADLVQD